MAEVKSPPFPPLSLPLRIVKLHAKLAIAILIGIAVAVALAVHGVLSFFFNLVVLALTVNMVANLM